MNVFAQQAFNGLAISGIYILIGLGITLIFGLTRLVNFAHGHVVILGGYITLELSSRGTGFPLAALLAVGICGSLGYVMERGLFRPTLKAPLNGFLVSLGLIIVLQQMMVKVWGPNVSTVSPVFEGSWSFLGVYFAKERLLILAVTTLVLVLLIVLLYLTRIGRAMRAVAEDREASAIVGVNVGRVISITFVIGTAIAGLGGALLGTLFPFTPFTGGAYALKGFVVSLVGGLGNVWGAIAGGLLLGLAETFGAAYWDPSWTNGFGLAILFVVMLIRPTGFFGSAQE